VTEPIEFSFMFLAPVLYAIHAVLTGVAMVVMDLLNVRLGFSFSAGLFDYVLNFGLAENPLLLLPVGAVYAVVYYALFRFFIARFNLPTPGREAEDASASTAAAASGGSRGADFVQALGGPSNLKSVNACTTRLRLVIGDRKQVDEAALKRLGARGVISPSPTDLQVVVGPIADSLADELKAALAGGGSAVAAAPTASGAKVLKALGGAGNLEASETRGSRVLVTVRDMAKVDRKALDASGLRAVAEAGDRRLHLVVGPTAATLADALV
jgi:N-acetylglucosamine PTS system EIICBA or EIICB component